MRTTACPFADLGRLAHFTDDGPLEDWCASFAAYARAALEEDPGLDGLFASVAPRPEPRDLADLGALLRAVLERLGDEDHPLAGADRPEWWFDFLEERWVVLVFSPLYPPASPRFSAGPGQHLFLQRERSFDRHRDATTGRIPLAVRRRIRARFAAEGRPYCGAIAEDPREAAKFLLPLVAGAPAVVWWDPDGQRRPEGESSTTRK